MQNKAMYIPPDGGRAAERLVREVREEFSARQAERRLLERGWELDMNFLAGNDKELALQELYQ